MRVTPGGACSKGSAFISATTLSARKAGQHVVFPKKLQGEMPIDAKRDRDPRTWLNLIRIFTITAVKLFPQMETATYHHSILAIPRSIIPSRLWPPVPLSASVPLPEVCTQDSGDESQVDVILWSLEASSSLPLPAVLTAPIRLDVVQQVHSTHILDQDPRDGVLTIR